MQEKATAEKGRRWRGLTRDDRDAARQLRLLEAGLEQFGTNGFAAASVSSICANAKVSTRNFYEYFADREALLIAVYDEIVEDLVEALDEALEASPDELEAMVRAGVEATVGVLLDDERKARLNCFEVVGVSREMDRHRYQAMLRLGQIYSKYLGRLVDAGEVPDRDFMWTATGLIGGFTEMLRLFLEMKRRPSRKRLIDEVISFTQAALATR